MAYRLLVGLFWLTGSVWAETSDEVSTNATIDFSRDIRPILAKHCYACHGPDTAESGLALIDFESATRESDSGEKAIVPGDVASSELVRRIESEDEFERMPPDGEPLGKSQIELLKAWIASGAEYTPHWSFSPIERPSLPSDLSSDSLNWSEGPIDLFIAEQLEKKGLAPSEPADLRTLARRLYLNTIGVPPTTEELHEFYADALGSKERLRSESSIDGSRVSFEQDHLEAYERLVDRLLADPRFGERWGRTWLDVVRYAETNSFERDGLKPNAWRYRDYVIQAFNNDKPYDQFIREQIAGDELQEVTPETLAATGFFRLGIWDDEPADPQQSYFDEFDDYVTVVGQGFLGLTFNCARCHDHKIDPISAKDYYQLVAFMRDVTIYGDRGDQRGNNQVDVSSPEAQVKRRELETRMRELRSQAEQIEQEAIVKMPAEDQRATEGPERNRVLREKLRQFLDEPRWNEYQQIRRQRREVEEALRQVEPGEFVLGLAKTIADPPQTFVLLRGSPQAEGEPVSPAFPSLFQMDAPEIEKIVRESRTSNSGNPTSGNPTSAGRRRVLADWLSSRENWFTARVIVNRIWQNHFGRGIVRSANNFGQLGDPPSHPELLDWLASELVDHDWSMKAIHKQILMSAAYRMSSQIRPEAYAIDPDNETFWAFPLRRLSAEELRDSILAVSGDLNLEKFGPSFYPKVADEVKAGQSVPGQGWGNSSLADQARRSIYIHIKRSLVPPELSVFDFPETDTPCEARFLTTQPAQALGLLNGLFIQNQATRFADRIERMKLEDQQQKVAAAIELAYGRPATANDVARAEKLFARLESEHGLNADQQFREYCLVLMNTNEFLYLD